MFSGIKSIIFGYSEAENSTSGNNESALSINSSKSADASALLEQTLNAAATKFTEQLLPQSPSIEQLQSSSHQLLPTLSEQHEENILKKQKQIEVAVKPIDEDDDGCFNADSWELLDLVEKPEIICGSLISTVQDDSVSKAGGILKQKSNKNNNNNNNQDSQAAERQKQKVSFEAPDLVKGKQKIETTTPKDKLNSGKASKNNNKKRNKRAKASASDKNAIALATSASTEKAVEIIKPDENVEIEPELEMPSWQQQQVVVKKAAPVLNYAAALAMKLKRDDTKVESVEEVGGSKPLTSQATKIPVVAASRGGFVNLQASGAVKRNRPVSSSSWSSSDEIETIDSIWNDIHCESQVGHQVYEEATFEEVLKAGSPSKGLGQREKQSAKKAVQFSSANSASAVNNGRQIDDDEESIISSGFSDCDYGYEGLNDYIMRPKKAQNKRRGMSANSNSLLTSMFRRGKEERQQQQPNAVEETVGYCQEPKSFKGKASTSMKHIKPKKKKMTLSAMSSPSSSEFLKKRCAPIGNREPVASSSFVLEESGIIESDLFGEQRRQEVLETEATETVAPRSPAHLMPPPPAPLQAMATSSTSGNDSSDVPEMDESWYVTPPSCFTGSNKLIKKNRPVKAKEAARENALIEHPSIYIASTSKTQKIRNQVATSSKLPMAELSLAKPTRAFVLRKVSKQSSGGKNAGSNISSSSSEFETKKNKSSSSALATNASTSKSSVPAIKHPGEKKKSSAKAWENKFIVTNWNCDEQDDINDFDNLFEADESSQSTPKIKKSRSKGKQRKSANLIRVDSPSLLDVSAGYESDEFSIPASVVCLSADLPSDSSSVEIVEQQSGSGSPTDISVGDENLEPSVNDNDGDFIGDELLEQQSAKPFAERRAPIQVRPIEPERQPGWQLRRKRSRRRPLSISTNTYNAAAGIGSGSSGKRSSANSKSQSPIDGCNVRQMPSASAGSNAGSQPTSARSSPTLIDRISSSIVANLSSLTNGAFHGATAMGLSPVQVAPRATIEEAERLNQSAVRKSSGELISIARRRLSKGYLDRQNDCSRLSKSNRRADRRLKMHSTPNGCSVNRKVQTNFH